MLLHELVTLSSMRSPDAPALTFGDNTLTYASLASQIERFASGLIELGIARAERVGIYLEKQFENVVAVFGAAAAGCVFVPINPLLKPQQVGYILRDCNVRVLVTSIHRFALLHAA